MARLKIKLQLYCGDEIAMGPGKADLLDAIAATGSISGAARSLGMSYRRGWLLVDVMNRCFAAPLVDTQPGGGKGAGARLTEAGQAALASYRGLSARLESDVPCADFTLLEQTIRSQPLPPASPSAS